MPYDASVKEKPLHEYQSIDYANECWQNYLVTQERLAKILAVMDLNPDQIAYPIQTQPMAESPLWWRPNEPDEAPPLVQKRQALRLLQEGRARLALPGVWIKTTDRLRNHEVPGGYQFCSRGVVIHLAVGLGYQEGARKAITALAQAIMPKDFPPVGAPHGIVASFNDWHERTLEDVLGVFDEAISDLEMELGTAMA